MSKINSDFFHTKVDPFKINRIPLLNQSGLNILIKKKYVPQRRIDVYTNLLINNKNIKKPFEIHFAQIQSTINNYNSKIKEKNHKVKPLTKKNKIIRKHNILQKIDFNINKNNNSRNLELKLYNNINNKLYSYKTNLYNPNIENNINLPLLLNTNRDKNLSLEKENKKSLNSLKNRINISSSYNSILPSANISSPSARLNNNLKLDNIIFSNEKIKNTNIGIPKKSNFLYTDVGMQTNNDYDVNVKNKEKKIASIHSKTKSNDDNDDSSSNDFEDMKEIENIISSESSRNNYNYNNLYYNYYNSIFSKDYINTLSNTQLENKKKKDFLFVKSLSAIKNIQEKINNKQQPFKQSKTSRNIYNKENSLNNKSSYKVENYYDNNIKILLNNSIINKGNLFKNKEIFKRGEKINLKPYNQKKKLSPNNQKGKSFDLNTMTNHNFSFDKQSY